MISPNIPKLDITKVGDVRIDIYRITFYLIDNHITPKKSYPFASNF